MELSSTEFKRNRVAYFFDILYRELYYVSKMKELGGPGLAGLRWPISLRVIVYDILKF